MRVLSCSDLSKAVSSGSLLWDINIMGEAEQEFLQEYGDRDTEELVRVLHLLPGETISDINLTGGYYIVAGRRVPLVNLSTAEKIFLFAKIAEVTGRAVYFYRVINQLTDKSLAILFNTFAKCDTVNIVPSYKGEEDYYRMMEASL